MAEVKLPEGWCTTKIDEIAEVKGGKRLPKGKALLDTVTEHPYVRVTDFEDGSVDMSNLKYLDSDTFLSIKNYIISKDDLYISIAGTIGLVGEIPDSLDGANLTENAAKICELTGVIKKYLRYVLNSISAKEQFEDKTTSSGQPKLALFRIKDCTFPLPPLAEQKIIADKLDTLLAQVENTKARLDRIPQILSTFRQSVLAAAVSGKLTEEWYTETKKLLDVSDFQNGYAFKSDWFLSDGSFQVIKLGNIRDGRLALENSPAYIDESVAVEFSKFGPQQGDTLISMTGTRFKKDYGFGCLIGDHQGLLINQRVGRLIPNRTIVTPEYLNIFIRSDLFRDQFFEGETGGVNQGNVGSKHVMAISIEIPDIGIQTEIVRRVEQFFAYADKIEQQVQAAQQRVDKLTQSILAKAFRGELTAQWRKDNPELISGDNSAEALLAMIKTERETKAPKKKVKTLKAKA
jgi:type I restriction enzyme S subunit